MNIKNSMLCLLLVSSSGIFAFPKIEVFFSNKQDEGLAKAFLATICSPEEENPALLRSFIEKGVDVNMRNEFGMTPLMFAVYGNKLVYMEILLKNRAQVNACDPLGTTALDIALYGAFAAKDMIENNSSLTVKEKAELLGKHMQTIMLLERCRAKTGAQLGARKS